MRGAVRSIRCPLDHVRTVLGGEPGVVHMVEGLLEQYPEMKVGEGVHDGRTSQDSGGLLYRAWNAYSYRQDVFRFVPLLVEEF